MSCLPFRFVNGELKMKGARRALFEIDTPALPKPTPTVAPEPVAVVEVPTAAPLEVEAPAEVPETSPESGLAPEEPPTE
jgi:hypothetical protein